MDCIVMTQVLKSHVDNKKHTEYMGSKKFQGFDSEQSSQPHVGRVGRV